jgi:hypothetical protein
MYYLLADTGFWIALLDPSDDPERSELAEKIANDIQMFNIVVPYPTLYEFVNSKFSRGKAVKEFERILKLSNVTRMSDHPYKEDALDNFIVKAVNGKQDVSLVDEVLLLMLSDKSLKFDYLISFDVGLKNQALGIGVKAYE